MTVMSSKQVFLALQFPDPNNQEACQQYFMQEIQLGEILLSNGRKWNLSSLMVHKATQS